MKKINWFQLLVIVLITELVGVLSNLFSGDTRQIYTSFMKPPLSPPGWLFGLIWPVLYLMMGIAVYIIYQTSETPSRKKAITLYWTQLFVNFLWPIVFFRFEWYWISVLVILLLDVLVLMTMIWFYKIKKVAGVSDDPISTLDSLRYIFEYWNCSVELMFEECEKREVGY